MITNLLEKLIARRLVLPNVWFRPFLKDDPRILLAAARFLVSTVLVEKSSRFWRSSSVWRACCLGVKMVTSASVVEAACGVFGGMLAEHGEESA